jgi:hypothetical protein
MLEQAGVEMLFNTWISRGIAKNETARGLIYENKQGRQAAFGKCVLDCTGDADVAADLKVPTMEKPDKHDTLLFRVGNVDFQKTIDYLKSHPEDIGIGDEESIRLALRCLEYEWIRFGFFTLPDAEGSTLRNLVKQAVSDGSFGLDNLDAKVLTQSQIAGREAAYFVLEKFLKPYVPGFENSVIVSTGSELGVRTSRTIVAEYNLENSRDIKDRLFEDVIAVASFDQQSTTEIPYRALLPKKVKNLIVASGRSFPNDSANPFRETAICVSIGQAAGVAAALSSNSGIPPHQLDRRNIQEELLKQGAYLGSKERLAELSL